MALNPDLIMQFTDYWVNTALFQTKRLSDHLAAQEETHARFGNTPWTREQWAEYRAKNRLGESEHLVEEAEGFFMMLAVNRVLRWLPKAVETRPELQPAKEAFEAATEHVIDMRNMLEHDDAYLDGKGNAQKRYLHRPGEFMESPAHSITVTGDGDYLLGGRVSVPKLLAALQALQPSVYKARLALWNETHTADGAGAETA